GRVRFLVEPHSNSLGLAALGDFEGVESIARPKSPHPRVDAQPSCVRIGETAIGGDSRVIMAGPCSVESEQQIDELAARLSPLGVRFLRGGAYKPRSSPYSFQGHGEKALSWLRRAADAHGLAVVTEATGVDEVARVAEIADLVQVGSRNMQN